MRTRGHCLTFDPGLSYITISNILKATWSVITKFSIEPHWAEERNGNSNSPGHMTNMAAMPVHSKNLYKSSSLEPVDRLS